MPILCKGSQMLKAKRALNYRKGNKDLNCGNCNNFNKEFQFLKMDGTPHKLAPRCKVIGLESSIRYQVNAKYVCDGHTSSPV